MQTDAKLLEKFPLVIMADGDGVFVITRKTGPGCRWHLAWWLGDGRTPKTSHKPVYAHQKAAPRCKATCKKYVRGLGEQICFTRRCPRQVQTKHAKRTQKRQSAGVERMK